MTSPLCWILLTRQLPTRNKATLLASNRVKFLQKNKVRIDVASDAAGYAEA
jgi:hypothetical protein